MNNARILSRQVLKGFEFINEEQTKQNFFEELLITLRPFRLTQKEEHDVRKPPIHSDWSERCLLCESSWFDDILPRSLKAFNCFNRAENFAPIPFHHASCLLQIDSYFRLISTWSNWLLSVKLWWWTCEIILSTWWVFQKCIACAVQILCMTSVSWTETFHMAKFRANTFIVLAEVKQSRAARL